MIPPDVASGRVERTVPSVLRASGSVKTSSVGMFGTCTVPPAVSSVPAPQLNAGVNPIVRSVPGPVNRSASKRRSVSSAARERSFSTCARHAATGSASSSRTAFATSSQSRSTSGVPKIFVAQFSFG